MWQTMYMFRRGVTQVCSFILAGKGCICLAPVGNIVLTLAQSAHVAQGHGHFTCVGDPFGESRSDIFVDC